MSQIEALVGQQNPAVAGQVTMDEWLAMINSNMSSGLSTLVFDEFDDPSNLEHATRAKAAENFAANCGDDSRLSLEELKTMMAPAMTANSVNANEVNFMFRIGQGYSRDITQTTLTQNDFLNM